MNNDNLGAPAPLFLECARQSVYVEGNSILITH